METWITLAGIAALFGGVYLLPPDTSLAEVKRTGALAVCVPTLYPPLVTGQPEAPGFDVEFVQAIARRLGVIMVDNANVARGRVSEALLARQISGTLDLQIAWMPEPLVRYPVAFGLWKGDLTLKRRLGEVIDELESEGLTRELSSRYRIAPIEATLRLN